MTQFLLDIASYQHYRPDPINLAAAQAKGFSLVNIKTTEGTHYTFSAGKIYADKARELGMGICTFHYLNREASGAAQADFAWRQILNLGGPQGIAHECDCETTATETIWRDYTKAMQDKMQRHILCYSGDWWWQARGWIGSDLTPYYTAAPNDGNAIGSYPGDKSIHWQAGYGGWDYLSMMQYSYSTIPGIGGGDLSQSAIRDPRVWPALTGGSSATLGDDMFCKQGDGNVIVNGVRVPSDKVEAYQRLLLVLDPACLPQFGPDGGYGKETTAAGAKLLGGDGMKYGPIEYAALAAKIGALGGGAAVPELVAHTHTFDSPAGTSGPAVAA